MTKEYHVFTNQQSNHEQAFVFEVNRENDFFEINELWLINIHSGREIKTRINMENIMSSIGQNVGGTIKDKDMDTVLNIFKEILPEEKRLEVHIEVCQRELEQTISDPAERLIKASEYAKHLDSEITSDVQKLIDSIVDKRSNHGRN